MPTTCLCAYHYDPLDRLTSLAVATLAPTHRFYCKSRLATEIEGAINRSIVQHDEQLLALAETKDNIKQATLVATDQQRSVLQAIACNESQSFAYSPYGHRTTGGGILSLLGFNGERPDPVTGHYLLGNGYRAFNPSLMRFNSPDRFSPFGIGGLNAYVYCLGDPINGSDPNGTTGIFKIFRRFWGGKAPLRTPPRPAASAPPSSGSEVTRRIVKHQRTSETITTEQVIKGERWNVHSRVSTHYLEMRGPVYQTKKMLLIPTEISLQQMAYSEVTLPSDPNLFRLIRDLADLQGLSKANFFNHIQEHVGQQKIYYREDPESLRRTVRFVPELDEARIYRDFLREAKSGKLLGVDPAIADSWPSLQSIHDYNLYI